MTPLPDADWIPPAAYDLDEMPVPCPECASETFDELGGTVTCSDCGWRKPANRAYKSHANPYPE